MPDSAKSVATAILPSRHKVAAGPPTGRKKSIVVTAKRFSDGFARREFALRWGRSFALTRQSKGTWLAVSADPVAEIY
jgi:hypothetical protein